MQLIARTCDCNKPWYINRGYYGYCEQSVAMGGKDPDLLKIGFVLIKMLGFREDFFKKIPKAVRCVLVLVIAVPPGLCLAISAQQIFLTQCEVKCFSENVFVLAAFTQVLTQ